MKIQCEMKSYAKDDRAARKERRDSERFNKCEIVSGSCCGFTSPSQESFDKKFFFFHVNSTEAAMGLLFQLSLKIHPSLVQCNSDNLERS